MAQPTLQSSSMTVPIFPFTLEQKESDKKNHVPKSNLRRRGETDGSLSIHLLRFVHDIFHIIKFLYLQASPVTW